MTRGSGPDADILHGFGVAVGLSRWDLGVSPSPSPGQCARPAPPGPMPVDHDVTGLLVAWREGDATAVDHLFPLVYEELRRIAHRQLSRERSDHTLGTTA